MVLVYNCGFWASQNSGTNNRDAAISAFIDNRGHVAPGGEKLFANAPDLASLFEWQLWCYQILSYLLSRRLHFSVPPTHQVSRPSVRSSY